MALLRQERRARAEELRYEVRTWSFWRDVLGRHILPLLCILVIAWSVGFVHGAVYVDREVAARFDCVAKDDHVD